MSTLYNLGLLLLRVSVSGIMILVHGLPKLANPAQFIDALASKGFPAPAVLGYMSISAETLFPLLIILGLYTRVSALITAGNMFVAAFVSHMIMSGDPFSLWEKALLYLIVFLFIAIAGSGNWTVGRVFGGK